MPDQSRAGVFVAIHASAGGEVSSGFGVFSDTRTFSDNGTLSDTRASPHTRASPNTRASYDAGAPDDTGNSFVIPAKAGIQRLNSDFQAFTVSDATPSPHTVPLPPGRESAERACSR